MVRKPFFCHVAILRFKIVQFLICFWNTSYMETKQKDSLFKIQGKIFCIKNPEKHICIQHKEWKKHWNSSDYTIVTLKLYGSYVTPHIIWFLIVKWTGGREDFFLGCGTTVGVFKLHLVCLENDPSGPLLMYFFVENSLFMVKIGN